MGVEVSGGGADEGCEGVKRYHLQPQALPFSSAFQVETQVRSLFLHPPSSDHLLEKEVGEVGVHVGGGWEGGHHREEDLSSLECRGQVEGCRAERDVVEVGSGGATEGS